MRIGKTRWDQLSESKSEGTEAVEQGAALYGFVATRGT